MSADFDFDALFDPDITMADASRMLMVLSEREDRADDIIAAVTAMRRRMVPVIAPPGAIDVCGTGGDNAHSLNISTAVAIVTAACGVPVAKHGSRAATSRAGAADTLEAAGIRPARSADQAERELVATNLTFLFAPAFHPALAAIAPARRAIGRRTLFNLIGPLANPARVTRQLVGLAHPALLGPYADAVATLGTQRTLLVSGLEGLDELSIAGPSRAVLIEAQTRTDRLIVPADAGVAAHPVAAIRGGDAAHNAAALLALLQGTAGAYADAVILNTAAALWVAGRADDLPGGGALARQAIESGAALATFEAWRTVNRTGAE